MSWSLNKAMVACDNHPRTPDEQLMRAVAGLHAAVLRGGRDAPSLAARATELLRRTAGGDAPSRPRRTANGPR